MLGTFFQCDPDIRICAGDVYLDPAEPRPLGVISHGHADHIGRHEHFISTPSTAAFVRLRQGSDLKSTEVSFGVDHRIGELTIRLEPAGHVLGSAMVRVDDGRRSLLYTGDFRLRPSLTAEPARAVRADALIMESTYGDPRWRFPSRDALSERLLETAGAIRARGRTAVLLAYSLGKAQEAMAMLKESGHRVVLHPVVAKVTSIYERFGVDLGRYETWHRQGSLFGGRATADLRDAVVVIPPHMTREIRRIPKKETVALTGWSLHGNFGRESDHALPLSDHADFDELIELVEAVNPEIVYVTHGSRRFARELRNRGWRAEFLSRKPQMRLF